MCRGPVEHCVATGPDVSSATFASVADGAERWPLPGHHARSRSSVGMKRARLERHRRHTQRLLISCHQLSVSMIVTRVCRRQQPRSSRRHARGDLVCVAGPGAVDPAFLNKLVLRASTCVLRGLLVLSAVDHLMLRSGLMLDDDDDNGDESQPPQTKRNSPRARRNACARGRRRMGMPHPPSSGEGI